jgi:hypothetical protein
MEKRRIIRAWLDAPKPPVDDPNAWYCSVLGLGMRLYLRGYITQEELEQTLATL